MEMMNFRLNALITLFIGVVHQGGWVKKLENI